MIGQLRKAEAADAEILLNFSRDTFFESFAHFNRPEDMKAYSLTAFTSEKIHSELNDMHSQFYLVMLEGEIAGYLKLNTGDAQTEFRDENSIEVERIYVAGKYHGKGLGGQLLHFAIETGVNSGNAFIWLGVWEHNLKAIGFYRHNGFKVFGKHDFLLGSDRQTDLLMRRNLLEVHQNT